MYCPQIDYSTSSAEKHLSNSSINRIISCCGIIRPLPYNFIHWIWYCLRFCERIESFLSSIFKGSQANVNTQCSMKNSLILVALSEMCIMITSIYIFPCTNSKKRVGFYFFLMPAALCPGKDQSVQRRGSWKRVAEPSCIDRRDP